MRLVERHIINKNHKYFKECDQLAFLSKNLYNSANFLIRQHFIITKHYLNAYSTQFYLQSFAKEYLALPAKVSQQTLRLLHKNWVSFFKANQAYKKNPSKFLGKPKLPKYKHKNNKDKSLYF